MAFFAKGRSNGTDPYPPGQAGQVEQPGGPSNTGSIETGLPPWVENAVKKLLGSVLPQFQPLIAQAEAVMLDAKESLAQQRRDQLAVLNALAELKETVERLERLALHDSRPIPARPVESLAHADAAAKDRIAAAGRGDGR